jgi:RNA polymerase sigma-70 factor (sigma-E family)
MDDRGDFAEWATSCYSSLLHAAHLLTGDRDSAQDLVQAALAKTQVAWRRVHTSPDAYVRRVLVTTHTDWWRRRPWMEQSTAVIADAPVAGDPTRTVDQRAALLQALQCLTPRQRAVVVLRHYHQLSEQETAYALDCSVGTVKSTASRALARLREHPALEPEKESC